MGDALIIGGATPAQGPSEGVTQRGTRIDNETGERTDLGIRCARPNTPEFDKAPPVVITVTQSDFARMPVKPLQAHAGPTDGWLAVNMINVLYAESEPQELSVELLDTPVAIRATPRSYHWNLGDGNTITTTNPGKPYPSEVVSATYAQEGWYDITLTTTFSGQFSVAGGEWQDIDGTIEVTSDPVPIYSKSLESRLVNGDVPVDEDEDPWIPERTPDTEGPQDPAATHRKI
ncbi:PKD domain-containing protein [Brachybacterium sp. Z12]|uniref:PKD domain-containing protein n=1 Tax=Brachybacterium sp. Z12 TaxID=2759167 RepID=UPI00223C3D4D|nr:PKD domain-containing protein [Brachybacterium sp. Z12]